MRPAYASGSAATRDAVEVISTESGLFSLKDEWNRLFRQARDPGVFSSFDWVWAWWRHLSPTDSLPGRKQLHVLVFRKNGAVVAIAPWMVRTLSRGGISARMIEFIGWEAADYSDFLWIGEGQAMRALAAHLAATRDKWDLIRLRDLPCHSATAAALEQALGEAGLRYRRRPDARCMYIPIRCDWSDYMKGMTRISRQTFLNQAHRLKRLEPEGLRIRMIDDPRQEPELLSKMVRVGSRKTDRSFFSFIALAEDFFRSLVDALGDQMYVAVMEKNSDLVAYEIGFRTAGKLWSYDKAYDPSFSYYSPGTMLMPAIINFGFHNGCTEYDFLRGDEAYKKRYTKHFHQNTRLDIWSNRWRSELSALASAAGHRLQRLRTTK